MDDGLAAIHRGVIYGYITINNNQIIWEAESGKNICFELLE